MSGSPEQLSYWKQELAGAPTKLELPTDRPRPATQSLRSATETFALPDGLADRLDAIARQEQASLASVLGAAFIVLLARYTGQDDILVATPTSGRTPGAAGGLAERAVNTVVVRGRLADRVPFRAFLRQVWERTAAAHEHSDVPFDDVAAEIVPNRDSSHAPLCQAMFVLDEGKGSGLETAHYDLALCVSGSSGALRGSLAYSADLFEPEAIQRLGGHYVALLEAIARDPGHDAQTLQMLPEREQIQVLREWNDTHVEYPDLRVHQLFERQVEKNPDAPALVFEDLQLTYREVNERANQVAHYLLKRGVGPEVLVGVCLERCPELVIALLGVWKAGGAYVPLDPLHPKERLSYMLEDAAAKVLLTDDKQRPLFPADHANAICIDSDWPSIAKESTANLESRVTPSNLAYVMYTSGSTGQPKGAMIVHHGLTNYLCWAGKAYGAGGGDAVPVHTSIAFDLTVTAVFVPLAAGGRIEILREDVGGQNLVAALRGGTDRGLVKITPAHLALLSVQLGPEEAAGRTRLFVIGGENLLADGLLLWRDYAPSTRLINEYGPTETVVGCCVHEVSADDPRSGSVPIGRPIANTQLYVLDRHMNPLPSGVAGELYIGGAGLARGYWNRPELTRERFVADPFTKADGARLYKTGDIARHRADGTLEYLGRVDNQVKVRGYRIELGEIEATLADQPGVSSCAVVVREDSPGNKQLVGYVVSQKDKYPTVEGLRDALRETLPEYMVPAQFVFLDVMPLTTNGKVDRKALPAPSNHESVSSIRTARVAPRTETEKSLAAIWTELLNVKSIGVNDNFFDLGGHSLLAIKAVSRIRDVFQVDLSPQAVIDDPTIAALAKMLGEATGQGGTVDVPMGPFFFGEPQLFGVYYPPQDASAREAAVLACPSIGHEYTRGHRAIKVFCETAARAGFPAMRFDYTGLGDSSGEFAAAGVETWCSDILRAAEELRTRSGRREVHVVGLRLGAALAAAAVQRAGSAQAVRSLCLWDPLLSGGEFLQQAKILQDLFMKDTGRFSEQTIRQRSARGVGRGDDLLLGYSFPDGMRRSLEQLDLRRAEAWPSVGIRGVLSEPSAAWKDIAPRLKTATRPAEWEIVTGSEAAWADYSLHEKTLRAGPLISRIVEHLAGRRS